MPSTQEKISRSARLTNARVAKKDEFYTKLEDIQEECNHYAEHFRHKNILCPCDGSDSGFLKYFEDNFEKLELRSLTGIGFNPNGSTGFKYAKLPGTSPVISSLITRGDFRSPEVLQIIKDLDIVITNPPFSLLREFMMLLARYKKQFLLIGNILTVFHGKQMSSV